jgi:hypothetical protein
MVRPEAQHDTARNVLGHAGMTRTRGPCRAQDLGTAGYMAWPVFWAVLGPAQHKSIT